MQSIRDKRFFQGLMAVIALLGGHDACRAAEYRYAPGHFSLTVPHGWKEMDPEDLARMNSETEKRLGGQGIAFVAGFVPEKPSEPWPYMLLQVTHSDMSKASYDSFEREFNKSARGGVKKIEGSIKDLMTNLQVGEVSLDRERNRYVVFTQSDLVGGLGKINTLTLGHLGAKGIVNLHCYALDPKYADSLPAFQSANDSFVFDQGFQFVPRSGFGFDLPAIGIAAIVGCVLGALGVVMSRMVKKKTEGERKP